MTTPAASPALISEIIIQLARRPARRAHLSYPERFFRCPDQTEPTERDRPMDLHGAFHVYDTTLRDGAQQEGLNLSVADKLTIARQLDDLGVGYIEGGWPGANPKDTEFFRRATDELDLKHAKLAAFGATRRAGVARRRRPAGRGAARQRRLAWSRWSPSRTTGTSSSRCGPRSRRTSRWSATPSPTCAPRGSRCSSTPSTSSTATAPTATTRSRCCGRRTTPAPRWSRCATPTAGCCPAGSPTWCTTSSRPPASGSASTATTTPAARSPTPWPPSTPAPRHVQGTINGYGERTGNADLVSVVANLELKLDRAVLPAGLLREATRIAHAVAEVTNVPPASRQPYVGIVGVRAQGRAARQRDQGRPGPLPAHGPGRRRQRHAAARLRHGRPRLDRAQGPRARLRPRSGDRELVTRVTDAGQGARGAAATPSRRPTRPSSCCWPRRSRARRPSYFDVESWRVITETSTTGPARRRSRRRR